MFDWISKNSDVVIAITATLAIIISFVSTIFISITFLMQRSHNRKTVRPIANFSIADYENRISVILFNRGTGPLLIKKLTVKDRSNVKSNIIDFMPGLPSGIYWSTFMEQIEGFAILPSESMNLIEFKCYSDNENEVIAKETIRKALSNLTVMVEYTDIYNSEIPTNERSLAWFGRHFEDK